LAKIIKNFKGKSYMVEIVEVNENNLSEIYEFGKVAKQADGAVWYKQGKAVLLAAVAVDKEKSEEDFLPLTVQYIEKSYAAAKIPGGFVKRESKPSDFETLTSRIVDRAIRPLFPKDFANNVVITILVLSSDSNVDFQIAALHAANAALLVSSLPINKAIAGVRIGKIDGKIVFNPNLQDLNKSSLDLLVVGSDNDIEMIEMRAIGTQENGKHQVNEIETDELIEILKDASKAISKASAKYKEEFLKLKSNDVIDIEYKEINEDIKKFILQNYQEKINLAINTMAKSERADALDLVFEQIEQDIEQKELSYDIGDLKLAFNKVVKEEVRKIILSGKRVDKRAHNEVRPIDIETNILPSVHGSTLFTRGETQALVTITLGDKKDAQMYELLTSNSAQNENFMVHYNFPSFCVGEAKPIGAPGRRELGHGNLAKRALEPTIELDNNQTIRIVSEILESNGSSSMATVCGGSLSLYCANVNVKKLVAGVAMGVVVESGDNYAILTDIMGAEDHYGDMDLKVAGTKDGITALQLDIKLSGLSLDILQNALYQAKDALLHILEIMEQAKENIIPSAALPSVLTFEVSPRVIPLIIGKGGSTIREIIEKFNISIDLDRDKGVAKLSGDNLETLEKAKSYILKLILERDRF
jgi:polyribonucleotide nucleotidyltransferase